MVSAPGRGAVLLSALLVGSSVPLATADAQATPWKIQMRQVRLPVPNGDCGPIELVALDASGRTPVTPDGKQVDWQDFDIELTQGNGPLKLTGNGRFLCATAPGATGVVTAKYPEKTYLTGAKNRGRTGKLLIPGVTALASFTVHSAGSPPAQAAAPPPASQRAELISPAPPIGEPITATGTRVPALGPSPVIEATVPTPAAPVPAVGNAVPALGPSVITATAAIPPRIQLAGFAGSGLFRPPPPPPRIELAGFAGSGLYKPPPPPPRIELPGFTGTGAFAPPPPPPRIFLDGFKGSGLFPTP